MKTFMPFLVLVAIGAGIWWWNGQEKAQEPASVVPNTQATELCFAKFEDSLDSEFKDKYTLKFELNNKGNAAGELRMLPAEKDALIGQFTGMVSGGETPLRTLYTWWETEGEAMTATQELNIIFDQTEARPGFGEMALKEDGKYAYKDATKIDYSLALPKIPCEEFNERAAVEKYLWENIATLSPIAPALGGNWYVVAATLDLQNNSGTVTYEDGHVQEKRDFTYVLKADGLVEALTIK